MDKTNNISTLTTIGIDRQTGKLIDKLCKRYSLKKGEIVRLAFVYIDKACINPSSLRGRTTKSDDTNRQFYCGSV